MLDPVALQRAEVVTVTELVHEALEDRPVPVAACRPELALEMALDIGLDVVVVEQGVVDIDEEDR